MKKLPLLHALADLILAPVCLGCDAHIDARARTRLVCHRCSTRLRAVPTPACERCGATRRITGRESAEPCPECVQWPDALRFARSACLLYPPADQLVHQLKYGGWRALADVLALRMTHLALPAEAAAARACVPVPTTHDRLRERGYNQAECIARAFVARTGRTLVPVLVREAGRTSQTTLQPVGRRANVAGAFRVREAEVRRLVNAHVLLIDDVLTTGATAAECARTLACAGVPAVTLITFARALDARRLTSHAWSDDK